MVLGYSTLESLTSSVNATLKSSSNYHNVQGKFCMVGDQYWAVIGNRNRLPKVIRVVIRIHNRDSQKTKDTVLVYNHGCQLFEKSQITDHKTAASLLLGLCCRFFHANQRFFKNLNILIYFWLPT